MRLEHRCAVCWQRQRAHENWQDHAVQLHGMDPYGYTICPQEDKQPGSCPGIEHARRLKTEGVPVVRKAKPAGPVVARDGFTYTPVELPWE